jgi:hypothetical protein
MFSHPPIGQKCPDSTQTGNSLHIEVAPRPLGQGSRIYRKSMAITITEGSRRPRGLADFDRLMAHLVVPAGVV